MRIMILSCLTGVALTSNSWGAEPLRVEFDDLTRIVDSQNQHVSGARLRTEATEKLTGYLARSYLPVLDAHIGGESFKTGPFSSRTEPFGAVEARLNLFRGGRDYLEERARQAQSDAGRAGFQQTRLEELTKARRAYWTLVNQRELIVLLEDALRQNEANLASGNKRIKAGLATETDRIEFEMYGVQLQQDLARMRLGSANSQRALSVLLGKPENTQIETITSVPHQHDDALLTASLQPGLHRDVQALTANEEAARSQTAQAYRWWAPSLDVYANYSLYTLRERDYEPIADRYETVAGVKLTFNLFDGLQSFTTGASLGLQAEGLSQQASQTAKELSAQFEGSKQELELTHDLIHAAEESVKRGERYLQRTQSEYGRGFKNSPDVFSATEKYIDLKRRYAELRRDYQLAKTDLLAILGR